jgi:HPr kinase/phosphorylase
VAAQSEIMHATTIAAGGRAAMICGASGRGKSDLALRCLAVPEALLGVGPVGLVSDDQTIVRLVDGDLLVSAPEPLRGLLEVRGVGICKLPYVSQARLNLIVDLVDRGDVVRMPQGGQRKTVLGVAVRRVALAAFEYSAPLKVLMALAGEDGCR